jgi:hypothetical protein
MTFQPEPRNRALEFPNDLTVAANRPVQALEITVDDEGEVVETLPRR